MNQNFLDLSQQAADAARYATDYRDDFVVQRNWGDVWTMQGAYMENKFWAEHAAIAYRVTRELRFRAIEQRAAELAVEQATAYRNVKIPVSGSPYGWDVAG